MSPPRATRQLSGSECDCNRGVKPASIISAWRTQLSIQAGLANAGIRTRPADNRPASLPLQPLSSKCKFASCDLRRKPVPLPRSCAHGASATGTGATYQSGCSTSGESRWIQPPASESVRARRSLPTTPLQGLRRTWSPGVLFCVKGSVRMNLLEPDSELHWIDEKDWIVFVEFFARGRFENRGQQEKSEGLDNSPSREAVTCI